MFMVFIKKLRLYALSVCNSKIKGLFYRLLFRLKYKILDIKIFSSVNSFLLRYCINYKVRDLNYKKIFIYKSKPNNEKLPFYINLLGDKFLIDKRTKWHSKVINFRKYLKYQELHYMDFIEKLSFNEGILVIEDWIENNKPFCKYFYDKSWNQYTVSKRVYNWILFLSSFRSRLERKKLEKIEKSIFMQIRYIKNNLELDICGNHLIKNIKTLILGSLYFDSNESKVWLNRSIKILKQELDVQILDDGFHFELSPSYHLIVMEDLLEIKIYLEYLQNKSNVDFQIKTLLKILKKKLNLMLNATRSFIHPDGLPSLFADSGLHMSSAPREIFDLFKYAFKLKNDNNLNRKLGINFLNESGYLCLNTTHECLIVDCGKVGADSLPAHGHGDALSFEWSIFSKRVIIDAGVYEYTKGEMRNYSRSSYAHNTLTLNKLDQSEFWSNFRVARRANVTINKFYKTKEGFYLDCSHDGYRYLKSKPIHKRIFRVQPGLISVKDEVINGNREDIYVGFLLSPDVFIKKIKKFSNLYVCEMTLIDKINDIHKQLKLTSSAQIEFEKANFSSNLGHIDKTIRILLIGKKAPGFIDWKIET